MRYTKNTNTLGKLAAVAVAGLLLSGCSASGPDTEVTQTAPTRSQETVESGATTETTTIDPKEKSVQKEDSAQDTENLLSLVAAAQIALDAHPGTEVLSIDLDRVRGVSAWEVEVGSAAGQWEVSVDVTTGEIIKDEEESSGDLHKHLGSLKHVKVPYEEAVAIMEAAVPGGSLVEIELDHHHGTVVWEGDVMSKDHVKHELTIDAATGEVLDHEIDD